MKSKKLITSLLTVSMLASTVVPAFAAEPNEVVDPLPNEGYSSVTLEVKDSSGGSGGETPDNPDIPPVDPTDIIIATVPVELPIIMDLEGNVTVPTDAKIINHSTEKGIKVTKISAALESDWAAADYSDDFTTKADNTKELGMSLRGDTLKADGTFPITDGNWNIAKDNNLPLNMGAKLPKQTETAKTKIATVGFTIDWSGLDGTDGGSDPDAGKDNSEPTPDNSNPSNGLVLTNEQAQNIGFTFAPYETGLEITSFENKQSKSEINIPEQIGDFKVLSIGQQAFSDQSNITKVTMPDSIKILQTQTFANCHNLKSIVLSRNLTIIGNTAFINNTELTDLKIPEGVTSIGSGAFVGCSKLTTIEIPNGVTVINQNTFKNCSSLTNIKIHNKITSIGEAAFYGCTQETIEIPDSVKTIGIYAFKNVPHITYHGTATGSPWGALSIN